MMLNLTSLNLIVGKKKEKALENIEQFAASSAGSADKNIKPTNGLPESIKFTDAFHLRTQINTRSQEIIEDLRQNTLFDRLVCGDVGFGKTEIALRTAFIASAIKVLF